MATVLERRRVERTTSPRTSDRWLHQENWAASRARIQRDEKELMAQYFADHDFLLEEGANPATGPRENTASILVNQGTGPNLVVDKCLRWVEEHPEEGPFHITWYSPGALVPATLFDFRQKNPDLTAATHVHLLPGTVDLQLQAQIGTEAQDYARQLTRQFSYMILSGHSFDLETGDIKFNFDREIPIQRTCARLRATEKFLFFDSKKFTGEGEVGYGLRELLSTCRDVIIYTVSSPRVDEIREAVAGFAATLLSEKAADSDSKQEKSLRLTIVGRDGASSESIRHDGFLRRGAAKPSASESGQLE